jgi:hypothetical protein
MSALRVIVVLGNPIAVELVSFLTIDALILARELQLMVSRVIIEGREGSSSN